MTPSDKQLLDWLEAKHRASSFDRVVMRDSTTGRGWRLHSTTAWEASWHAVFGSITVRAAIAAAMERERNAS